MSNCSVTLDEVIEIRDRLKSFIDGNKVDSNSDLVLADLDTLKNFQFDQRSLGSTKIAGVISQLKTKPKNANVKKQAAELFEILKSSLTARAPSPKPSASEVPESTRKQVRIRLQERLQAKIDSNHITPKIPLDQVVKELEEAFAQDPNYNNKVSDFLKVLRAENKNELMIAERLLSGELKPEVVARFTSDDYMTAAEREHKEQLRVEAINEITVFKPPATKSEFFQCRRCKSRNISFYQLQTRSADEPMTNFCTCGDCGNTWKE
ncbi:transcription elongation factor A protein 1 isoform X3 [Histomonas meleagridis]|uniref:transcription elongation factor A protein 1 isoform X3 n=1 Tax=Histomonas meleagridis TaxID=135588 RepID=UPI00355A29EF|nr:transcription elongation factor A protein 1 isoform X3 [Histomonas meleagridis]KAH0802995.1 transcription elongation factor A protein 1 isoform X3 [Histomonas meleagridis]